MLSVKFLCVVIFNGLFSLYKGVSCSVTWSYVTDGSYSEEGRLKAMTLPSISHCAAECFVHTQCEVFGYNTDTGRCFMHDGTSSTVQSSNTVPRYYKATCSGTADYNFIKSLKKCLQYVSDPLDWEHAKLFCESSGGHLLMVKTQALLDYLNMHRETEYTKYWVGGNQTEEGSETFQWLSGEVLDSTNGGQLWIDNHPSLKGSNEAFCIETRYSGRKEQFGLSERECNNTRKFFCEMGLI